MVHPCKVEGCGQKEEYELQLRLQKEEYEERLRRIRIQTEIITTRCEERLRVQKDEYERALLAQRKAIINYFCPACYPLPLEDLPLEIIALIADFLHNFDDLGRMALVSRRVHNGVLLSQQWIVVEEIVAATDGSVPSQKRYLHDRRACAVFACKRGLLRSLRVMNLSRDEVTHYGCDLVVYACAYGQLDVLKYLHTTYALTAQDFWNGYREHHPMALAAKHLPVLKYLHSVMGFAVPRDFRFHNAACCLESLKFIHSDVDFAANRDRSYDDWALRNAARSGYGRRIANCSGDCDACAHERLVYLRDEYGITKEVAREAILYARGPGEKESIRDVFDLKE